MKTASVFVLSLWVLAGCKKASTVDALEETGAPASSTSTSVDAGSGGAAESPAASGSAAPAGSESDAAAGSAAASAAASGSSSAATAGSTTGSAAGGTTGEPGKDLAPTQPGAPAGVVEFLAISASGGTTDASVKAALDKAKNRYRGCYGKALANDSSTQGTLKLRATIASDGVVEKVDVIGGNLGLSPLVQCSVATTKSLKIAGAAAPATKATFDVKFSK